MLVFVTETAQEIEAIPENFLLDSTYTFTGTSFKYFGPSIAPDEYPITPPVDMVNGPLFINGIEAFYGWRGIGRFDSASDKFPAACIFTYFTEPITEFAIICEGLVIKMYDTSGNLVNTITPSIAPEIIIDEGGPNEKVLELAEIVYSFENIQFSYLTPEFIILALYKTTDAVQTVFQFIETRINLFDKTIAYTTFPDLPQTVANEGLILHMGGGGTFGAMSVLMCDWTTPSGTTLAYYYRSNGGDTGFREVMTDTPLTYPDEFLTVSEYIAGTVPTFNQIMQTLGYMNSWPYAVDATGLFFNSDAQSANYQGIIKSNNGLVYTTQDYMILIDGFGLAAPWTLWNYDEINNKPIPANYEIKKIISDGRFNIAALATLNGQAYYLTLGGKSPRTFEFPDPLPRVAPKWYSCSNYTRLI